mmetsp:Transcript_4049/g.11747  ORF Transcript_4049/g.11747 Transcript_4049/m.11747 type:complete len:512 (-) Transcript_4049:554-2089(-)
MRARHPQRQQLVASWDAWTQEHAAVLAPVRAVVVVSVALLVWWLAMAGHSGWPRTAGPTALTLLSSSGDEVLRCTAAQSPAGRMCLAQHVQHFLPATQLLRNKTGKASALCFSIEQTGHGSRTAALNFYDGPVVVDSVPALDTACEDITAPNGDPTVFMSRDNPSPHHLVRIQLLPLFLALQSFGMEGSPFQIVFVDDRPRDWSTPIFDDVAGLPSRMLSELPACFRAAASMFGVRYDNVGISAHAAATAAQTDMARPVVVAFGRWLLQRFGVTPRLTSGPTRDAGDGDLSDAGNQAKVLEAYSAGHDAVVCTRARATSTEGRLLRVLTLVVRTDKHNGQGRRLTGTEHLVEAAEACGFQAQVVDLAALPFAQQLQVVANSSVYVAVHGAAEVLLLALPPPAVAVQLMPYKFDDSHLYYHTFANWAAAAARSMLVWHNTNVWHTSPGRARVDDYKNHDTRMWKEQAAAIVAAAAAALEVPVARRALGAPLMLNQAVPRCSFEGVRGALGGC